MPAAKATSCQRGSSVFVCHSQEKPVILAYTVLNATVAVVVVVVVVVVLVVVVVVVVVVVED